jgi:hypothetical protein
MIYCLYLLYYSKTITMSEQSEQQENDQQINIELSEEIAEGVYASSLCPLKRWGLWLISHQANAGVRAKAKEANAA